MSNFGKERGAETSWRALFAGQFARRFLQAEDGVVTIFTIFVLLMMLLVAGIGVDLMQNEMRRTSLQNTVDRAVLAAADLDQTRPAADVVADYFDKAGLGEHLTSVAPDQGLNFRNVHATAFMRSPTQFMSLLGVNELPVPAASRALEEVPNVEISLVLDISGSMRFSDRMKNLRPAAKNFVDIVLMGPAADHTSINLIAYAGQTNPGPFMFNRLNGQRLGTMALDEAEGGVPEWRANVTLAEGEEGGVGSLPNVRYVFPNDSSCMELRGSDFDDARLPSAASYDQTPHFMNWSIATEIVRDVDDNPVYFDEDGNIVEGPAQGSTRWVMDWGWCPTDANEIIYASNDADALKTRIDNMRMHDGTGTHYAMKWALALLNPDSQPDFSAMAQPAVGLVPPEFANRPMEFNANDTVKYIVLMTDGQITEQVRPDSDKYLHIENPTRELQYRTSDRTQVSSRSTNVSRFYEQCDLAKDPSRNVVIYTIAFEAPGTPEDQMRECASSAAHFFRATGRDQINAAFSTIARQINELRLTQ
jgi:Flp pilus assembly protein TadG